MKRFSASFVISEMQIKMTGRYHFTSTRVAIIIITIIIIIEMKHCKCQQGWGEIDWNSCTLMEGMYQGNMALALLKQFLAVSQKN